MAHEITFKHILVNWCCWLYGNVLRCESDTLILLFSLFVDQDLTDLEAKLSESIKILLLLTDDCSLHTTLNCCLVLPALVSN